MRFSLPSIFCALLIIGFNLNANQAIAQNPNPIGEEQNLKTLINEVRLLRKTLLLVHLSEYKSQLIMEKLKMRNQEIDKLQNRLEDTQTTLSEFPSRFEAYNDRIKTMETQMQQEPDEKNRAQYEGMLKEFKSMISSQLQVQSQLQEKEKQLSSQLQSEQLKRDALENSLLELEDRLDAEISKQTANLAK
jgi:predicted  nucleic acid-binding Zn-ribbon protein